MEELPGSPCHFSVGSSDQLKKEKKKKLMENIIRAKNINAELSAAKLSKKRYIPALFYSKNC